MICEIPRGTNNKIEICTKEHFNPLKQDVKKNALRYLKYGNVICNYGAVSQTYEDPKTVNTLTGIVGDNDPLDVLEISETPMERGQIAQVKVLGSLALIDDGETDWKIIVINTKNPLAEKLNNIADVERLLPGRVSQLREWYRVYKTAEGKGFNKYAFDGKAIDSAETVKVIDDSHQQWHKLVADKANKDKAGIGKSLITLPAAKKALGSIPRI